MRRFLKCSQSLILRRPQSTSSATNDVLLDYTTHADKGIAIMSLNRGQRANAIGKNLLNMMFEYIQRLKYDTEIRAVILNSTEPKYFCAGADLLERAQMQESDVAKFVSQARFVIGELAELPMPTIAAMEGVALGGGLEMALACDFRIAADTAKLGLVETALAIIPGAGGTQRLPRVVGVSRAKELIFTGKQLSGAEAAAMGLVNECVAQNAAKNAATARSLELAATIAKKGPVAVRMAKRALNRGSETDLATGLAIEEACYAQVIPTKDRLEALQAFREKRPPVYKGC